MGGYFITLEGGEGAGKTTVLHALEERLHHMGYEVVTTREPGGVEISEKIREVILNPLYTEMDARTEALLYAAARRQHLVETIIPALNEGKIVLCDRFIDSSLVYQGYARQLGIEEVLTINQFAIQQCMPQLTLLLNVKPEKGLQRIIANKHREKNRLDLENLTFHERVYEGYQYVLRQFPMRIQKIDAENTIDHVIQQSLNKILHRLESNFERGL